MKSQIIPIFIMNRGCPNRCAFCNESILAGDYAPDISLVDFRNTVDRYLESGAGRFGRVQIAFYGGNFTGLDQPEQTRLLEYSRQYLESGTVDSLRISTRPDYMDRDNLQELFARGVRTVEIGAQSLNSDVLARIGRGHDADSIGRAVEVLKAEGFETGLHLMAGLPGESGQSFLAGIDHVIRLRPHMVRIHPTLVLRDTELERLYRDGLYEPLSLDHAVELCARALGPLKMAGISVVRLALHLSEKMKEAGNVVAGPFHPAFRSLVEERIYRDRACELLDRSPLSTGVARLFVAPGDLSRLRGLRNGNVTYLESRYPGFSISTHEDPRTQPHTMRLLTGRETAEVGIWSGEHL